MQHRILLIGANGMLGRSLAQELSAQSNITLHMVARNNADYSFDLTEDHLLKSCFEEVRPTVCINAAAIVGLDLCEQNIAAAYMINSRLPERLAAFCHIYNTYFVQVSTDHYYHGDERKKHDEEDPIVFFNEYARTKYAGECLALTYPNTIVLRTNIVGLRGIGTRPTFLEWLLNALQKGEELSLFTDFFTSSIHTRQFSKILLDILRVHPIGVLNLASSTVSSKEEFAVALSKRIFLSIPKYREGSVASLGTKRADSLGLSTTRIERLLGYNMPTLDEVIESIADEYKEGGLHG
jgi:dTDP-4-dehydrorhamnose reductase